MSAPPYMKLFWADYHQDTRHLNRSEHGAYFLLLGETWNRGGYLPDDDALLARWTLSTAEEWSDLKPIIMAFFTLSRGQWRHKRIARELGAYAVVSRKRKEAGKRGGAASHGKHEDKSEAIARQKPAKPEPEPYKSSEDKSSDGEAVARELNRTAWRAVVDVLGAANVPEPEARRFFGKLLADSGAQAKDWLPDISACVDRGTSDPRAYLKGCMNRRSRGPPEQKRVGFV